MTLKEFRNTIIMELVDRLGKEYIITEHDVDKINRRACQGILVQDPDSTITPVIYMEDYYEAYGSERISIKEIVDNIIEYVYDETTKPKVSDADMRLLFNWGDIKERVKAKLIPMDNNEEYLCDKVYVPFLNLAVVFYIDIYEMRDGFASVTITKELLSDYEISIQDLYKQAKENMRSDYKVVPMHMAMFDFIAESVEGHFPVEFDLMDPLYLLYCESKLHGAARIVSEEIRSDICRYFCELDVYVLPSSQHELILVPVINSYAYDPIELLEMVKEVNRTQVDAEDYLADHVYFLNGRTKELNIVA